MRITPARSWSCTHGRGLGYSQKDVEELARILTGVGIDLKREPPKLKPEWQPLLGRDGLFTFNPARHDFGDKQLLGHTITGRGFAEVEEALDILSREPATARHVSRQIALYFVADDPPPTLVEHMAQTFQRTDGDIAAVLDTMIHAPEFTPPSAPASRIRCATSSPPCASPMTPRSSPTPRPSRAGSTGSAKVCTTTRPGRLSLDLGRLDRLGPDDPAVRDRRQIGSSSSGLFKPPGPDAVDQPAFPLLQNSLYFSSLHAALSPTTRNALEQAVSPQDWNTLFLSSPEFMQ